MRQAHTALVGHTPLLPAPPRPCREGSPQPLREVAHLSGCEVLPDASSISSCALVNSFIASSLSARAPATSSPTLGWLESEGWRLAYP